MQKPFSFRSTIFAVAVVSAALALFWSFTHEAAIQPPALKQNASSARAKTDPVQTTLAKSATSTASGQTSAAAQPSLAASPAPVRLWPTVQDTQGEMLPTKTADLQAMRQSGRELTGRSGHIEAGALADLANLRPGETVVLPLLSGEETTGRVNLVQAESDNWIRVGGSLTGDREGTFTLNSDGAKFDGLVLLPNEALAVVITRQDNGGMIMEEKPIGEVLCTPMPKADVGAEKAAGVGADAVEVSAITIPILSSRPSATAVIYLDFDGETVTDPRWNGGQTIVAAAPNVSVAEINQAWASIKEDYWPFNIDVTTDVNRYNNAPVNRRTRCIITPTDTAAPGSGGVAYLNCFTRAGSTFSATIPCWVFVNGAKPIAEAASHEVGHTLGLHHDGRTGEEYYAGHGSGAVGWAPIMGVGYYRELVQWSKGEYPNASSSEADIEMISQATNGFGFVPDEAGNSPGTAAPLGVVGNTINQTGIISQGTDSDFYVVSLASGSTVSVAGNPAAISPNLDLVLELQNASGGVLATSNPDLALNASINTFLAAGTYYLKVQGTGRGSVAGDGYSNYGSIGAYTLTGTISGSAQPPTINGLTNQTAVAGTPTAPIGFTVADPDTNVNLLTVSATSSNQTVLPNSGISFGGSGSARTITLAPPALQAGASTITVTVSDGALTASGSFVVTVTSATTLPVFTLSPLSQSGFVGSSVSFTAAASGTPTPTYQWLKNNIPISGATGTTFTIAAVSLSDAGAYGVIATNSAGSVTSNFAALAVNNIVSTSPLLGGAVIATTPWNFDQTYRGANAFDGDSTTFFSGRPEEALVYVGRDFGTAKIVDRIRFLPRANYNGRMNGGRIRGANAADLSDAVTLYTINSTPPAGVWQDITLPPSSASYRYVFYTTTSNNAADVAELEFYGIAPTVSPVLGGTVIATAPWSFDQTYRGANAFDGNGATFFSGRPEDAFVYVGKDFGAGAIVDRIRYLPRTGFNGRMNGGRFRGANAADLSDAVTLYTINFTPPAGVWQDIALPASSATYRYVFYTTVSSNAADIAELEFYGTTPTGSPALGGTVVATAPWSFDQAYRGANAFDGNATTFFSGRPEDAFVYVGKDFGAGAIVDRIRYLPRTGFNGRMNGGRFRGANAADLSDAVTLYTINSTPPAGVWQDVALPVSSTTYRYVFYTTISSNAADIAELEFYGTTPANVALSSNSLASGDHTSVSLALSEQPTHSKRLNDNKSIPVESRSGFVVLGAVVVGDGVSEVNFTIEGDQPVPVLIRAVGSASENAGAAAQLDLWWQGLHLAGNCGVSTAPNAKEIAAALGVTDAIPTSDENGESAILKTLVPGTYSVTVEASSAGAGQIEVYQLFAVPIRGE